MVLVAAGLGSLAVRRLATGRAEAAGFRLANGVEAELFAAPSRESAALVLLVRVGEDHDPPGRSGTSHLLAAAGEVGGWSAAAGSDFTAWSRVVPAGDLPSVVDEAARRVSTPVAEADFVRARAGVLADIARRSGGDPVLTAQCLAAQAVQPARGGARRCGIPEDVEAVSLAEVEAFRQAHFTAGNLRIVAAGRFDAAAVRRRVETGFSGIPAGSAPVVRPPAGSRVVGTLVMGDAPSAVALAVPAPAPSDPLYPAFLILASRLQADSSSNRAWTARYDPLARPETLFIAGSVAQGEAPEPAADRIRSETAAILSPLLSPGEVASARGRFALLAGSLALDPATCTGDPRGFAFARARLPQLRLGPSFAQALEKTTVAQLAKAAESFDAAHATAVIAGGAIR